MNFILYNAHEFLQKWVNLWLFRFSFSFLSIERVEGREKLRLCDQSNYLNVVSQLSFSLSPARQKVKSTETLPRTKWEFFQGQVVVALFSLSKRKNSLRYIECKWTFDALSFPLFHPTNSSLSKYSRRQNSFSWSAHVKM